MPTDEIDITEISEFEPSRVDGVGKGANGFPILMLKQIDGETTETETDLDGALDELDKAAATDDRPACKVCDGTGKIMQGNRDCPPPPKGCGGTGKGPKVGESAKSYTDAVIAAKAIDGSADSGADVPVLNDCPTCNGSGSMPSTTANKDSAAKPCVDCGGSGKDAKMPTDDALSRVDADPGKITEGAGGRETVDKSTLPPVIAELRLDTKQFDAALNDAKERMAEFTEKATVSTADQNDAPDSDFAYIEPGGKLDKSGKTTPRDLRHFYIADAAHVRNALARASQSPFGDKAMPAIKAAAKKFDIEVNTDAEKASLGGSVFSAPNPALTAAAAQVTASGSSDDTGADNDDETVPGSPAWEAVDAQTATDAALALMTAVELLRTFANRETQEVVAGDASDAIDVYMVTEAICAAQSAIGVAAQLAFHEGLEAAKGLPDDEVVEKAGRRLAGKTVTALATARDKAKDLANHITGVLGDDDPAKKNKSNAVNAFVANANKALEAVDIDKLSEEIENMQLDELTKVLDAQNEKLVGAFTEALKAGTAQDVDNTDSVAGGKAANAKGKTNKKKVAANDDDDLEDEADQGDANSASKAEGDDADESETDAEVTAEKAELTPEEIEANEAAKEARKALKAAKRAKKEAAENAAVAKAIEEAVAKATEAVDSLKEQLAAAETATEERLAAAEKATQDRLSTVEKMAAPSNIVRTATSAAQNIAKERDVKELEISKFENLAKNTPELELRRGYLDRAKQLRAELSEVKN